AVVFLAIMAVSLVIMAAVQVGLVIVSLRVARQVSATAEEFRREIRPLIAKANALTDEATRVTTLALTQVERVDHAIATPARRPGATLSVLQGLMSGPVRQSSAVFAAVKAAWSVVRRLQERRSTAGREAEEDALFVG